MNMSINKLVSIVMIQKQHQKIVIMMKRNPNSKINLLQFNIHKNVQKQRKEYKEQHVYYKLKIKNFKLLQNVVQLMKKILEWLFMKRRRKYIKNVKEDLSIKLQVRNSMMKRGRLISKMVGNDFILSN